MAKKVSHIVNRGMGGPRKERKRFAKTKTLNITSLIDVLTILLVFLIKNVSMDVQKNTRPEGMSLSESITNEELIKDGKTIVIKIYRDQILFGYDNIPVGTLEQFATDKEVRTILSNLLSNQSTEIKKQSEDFVPSLLIQADKDIPCLYISEFIKLGSYSNFNNIYFSTIYNTDRETLLES